MLRLAGEVEGDADIVEQFVSDYLGLLDQRMSSLRNLLSADDAEATRVSILSLETTSAMLGAGDVVTAAQTLRRAAADDDEEVIGLRYEALVAAVTALKGSLASQGSITPP